MSFLRADKIRTPCCKNPLALNLLQVYSNIQPVSFVDIHHLNGLILSDSRHAGFGNAAVSGSHGPGAGQDKAGRLLILEYSSVIGWASDFHFNVSTLAHVHMIEYVLPTHALGILAVGGGLFALR